MLIAALVLLTASAHRDHRRASRDVEELYTLLEPHGDVERGHLTVSDVQRALPSSAREGPGDSTAAVR